MFTWYFLLLAVAICVGMVLLLRVPAIQPSILKDIHKSVQNINTKIDKLMEHVDEQ